MIQKSSLPDNARVWVYQSRLELTPYLERIDSILSNFINDWQSHGKQVKGEWYAVDNHFVIVMADENVAAVSGCSIDGLVSTINMINQETGLDLFDRKTVFFMKDAVINTCQLGEINELVQKGEIKNDTLMVNTLTSNLEELKSKWLCAFETSWHKKMII